MTKKIISFVLVFVLAFGCLCITNTASADSQVYGKEALQHIKNLGILPSDADGDDIITRGQFAQAIYNIAGDSVEISFERLYYDVEESDIYSSAVMYCSKNGYMVGSDQMFRPDDSITYIEAMTVIARVMNYTEYAKNHGDYTLGYYTTAKNIGLLNNTGIVSSDSPMTAENCAAMLYNALRIGMNKLSSINSFYYIYQTSTKIFAYEKLGLNYAKGIMQSNGYVDVSGNENSSEKSVIIDNSRYSSKLLDESFRFYVGQEVSAFYDDDFNIVSIAPTGTSNTVTINKENFVGKNGNAFSYNEDDVTKKLNVSDKAIYFKNGEVVMGYNATGFGGAEFADISFVDGNADDKFEYVFVNVYSTFVVSEASTDEMLYSADNTKKVDVSEESKKDIFVYNSNGELKTIHDIKPDYVVSVVENEEFVYIIYGNSVIKGELQEKDNYTVKVDGITVDMPNGASRIMKDISVGSYVSIYLDFAGRGVYASKDVNKNQENPYGYLVEGFFKDGFDKAVKIKIYNNSGDLNSYYLAKNFSVDGTRYKLNSLNGLPAVFYGEDGKFRSTVVFYELNSENEIVSIDFPKTSLNPDEDGFVQTAFSQKAYKLTNGTLTNRTALADGTYFSSKEFLNANSVVFVIPDDRENEDGYAIIGEPEIFESVDMIWDLFHFSKYNGFVDVAVIYSDYAAISYDTVLSVVTSVSKRFDADGNERFAVKYIVDGKEVVGMADETFKIGDYEIAENGSKTAVQIPITALKPGDAVRLTVGKNGLIRQGERVYEYGKQNNNFKGSSLSGAYATSSLYISSGYIAYADKTLIRFANTEDECIVTTHDVFNLTGVIYSSADILVVEETARGVDVKMGTVEDVLISDYVVYQSRSGVAKYIVVFKDK